MLLEGKTILVTEDNPVNRTSFQIILSLQGASVVFERFGPNAIDLAKSLTKLDLIVLDLMLMRGVSGYDLFEKLRKIPEFDHVPVVAISAADPTQAAEKCKEMGFNGFIPKPVDEQKLPGQLNRIMNGEEIWITY
ncbi:MAG: response regulator [Chloroflexota bacterium]